MFRLLIITVLTVALGGTVHAVLRSGSDKSGEGSRTFATSGRIADWVLDAAHAETLMPHESMLTDDSAVGVGSGTRFSAANPSIVVGGVVVTLVAIGAFALFVARFASFKRVRDSETRFRELFETMRSGVVVVAPAMGGGDFVVTAMNRAAERIDNLKRQDALGRKIDAVLPNFIKLGLLEVVRKVARTGTSQRLRGAFHQGEQSAIWRDNHIFRLPNGEVVIVYEDITEQQRAEKALRESEARWRSIIEIQAVAIVLVDQDHKIQFVNKMAEALFAQPAQELIGTSFGFPLVDGEMTGIEIIRPGRGIAFGEMRAVPMQWGGKTQFLLFIQDVSAHKRAEGDLSKLFQAIEQNPASVVITDVEGRIEYVNPKFTETTGYIYPEVVGKRPSILKSGNTSPEEYKELWAMITAGKVWRGEFHNKKKSGELFWELASIAPVRDMHGNITHFVAVQEDITDRKSTEERLRQSQRLEVIGQLTGGIAHDFNNLLAIIMGNLQLLAERTETDSESRELITDAIWSAERGAELTHRLLAFARRQRLNPKATDLNNVVGEMTDLLRRTLGERIEIREALSPKLWKTLIDRGQLESALLNLVVNSRDAMPNGGVLTLITENTTVRESDGLKSDDATPGDYVTLAVGDTGTGMPPEVVGRIFEPFFTTKKFGEGSGLGLSMVYGFVRQSGGHIAVDSKVGHGTTVKMHLPRAVMPEGDGVASSPDRRSANTGGEAILVVEDDARVRKTVIRVLRKQGYQVHEANNAKEALHLIERLPRLDLLFTDVGLPNGMNGLELAGEARRLRSGIRILFTSGYTGSALLDRKALEPDTAFLAKPYRREELTRKVREMLDGTPV